MRDAARVILGVGYERRSRETIGRRTDVDKVQPYPSAHGGRHVGWARRLLLDLGGDFKAVHPLFYVQNFLI